MLFPNQKSFAFTIIDDTDDSTLENTAPIYDYLVKKGILTTKTIWMYNTPENHRWAKGETMENQDYKEYVLALHKQGVEVVMHGPSGASSTRDSIKNAFATFQHLFGHMPRIHVNHAQNADNIYWGYDRIFPLRRMFPGVSGVSKSYGHVTSSPYFWGDICHQHIDYVRGSSVKEINTLKADPYMPYYEDRFPYVKAWFSGYDCSNASLFYAHLTPEKIDQLEKEQGACIVTTHFGTKGFLDEHGDIHPELKKIIDYIASKNGWFVPASTLLDYMVTQRGVKKLAWGQQLKLYLRQR